jgi:CheY-like chemotaxis protein
LDNYSILSAPTKPAKANVLVVEDHADSAKALARLLKVLGYSVDVAMGYADGKQKADQAPFDLLISDLALKDGNGLDLIRHLRSKKSPIKAIALTGANTPRDQQTCKEAGFDAHVAKPVDFVHLKQQIENLLNAK